MQNHSKINSRQSFQSSHFLTATTVMLLIHEHTEIMPGLSIKVHFEHLSTTQVLKVKKIPKHTSES